MNRHDSNRYDQNDYRDEYGRDRSYRRDDEHYHSARNLTNEFEREYRGGHGQQWDDDRNNPRRSYHESNDPDNEYERRMQDSGGFRWYSDVDHENRDVVRRFSTGLNQDRDRLSHYRDDYRRDQDRNWQSRSHDQVRGSIGGGYSTSDRYNTYGSDFDRDRRTGQAYYHPASDDFRGSGYGTQSYGSDTDYSGSGRGSSSFRNSSSGNYGSSYDQSERDRYGRGYRSGEKNRNQDDWNYDERGY